MELADIVARRRMVRRYRPDPVSPAAVEHIVEIARRAPSAGFAQAVSFVVVTDADVRQRIAEVCDEPDHIARGRAPWLSVAPVHVLPCVRPRTYRDRYAEPDKAGGRGPDDWAVPFWWVDGGAALMLLLLAAVDAGLDAGLLDLADREGVRALLGIPEDVEPVGLVTIGHPADTQPPSSGTRRPRRPLAEQLHWQHW
ncbi:MAG TPA: nitroreductase family protein [Euzebyales bacterium]|nr:nitroreductase family protein [Euzebyales bacterium]